MRIGVLSDTHVGSRVKAVLPQVFELFRGVDLILHAGDISIREPLDQLAEVAPVFAVHGNVDDEHNQASLPAQLRLDVGGLTIGVVHDSGPAAGRRARMRRLFPDCRVVVFGHSHIPVCEDLDGLLLLNPGSAGEPRKLKIPTVAFLEVSGGEPSATLVPVIGSQLPELTRRG